MKKRILILIMILIVIVYISPFIPLILSGISRTWRWPMLYPDSLSLRAWRYIIFDNRTLSAVFNTLIISFTVVIINILAGLSAANILARYEFRGKNIVEAFLFAPILIPPFISAMGIQFNFIKAGLTETLLGVILVHIIPTLPYMIRALIISYKTFSFDMENVAKSLGAGVFKRYYYVIFPHLLPAIIAGSTLTILISFSQYVSTLIIGGGEVLTLTILMFPFINGGDVVIGSAYVLLFTVLNILALFVMENLLKRFYGLSIKLNY